MELTAVGIFWLVLAAIFGPVFLVACVCSVHKAIKDRRAFFERQRAKQNAELNGALDEEIVTVRRPNIQLVEDLERKNKFMAYTTSDMKLPVNTVAVGQARKNPSQRNVGSPVDQAQTTMAFASNQNTSGSSKRKRNRSCCNNQNSVQGTTGAHVHMSTTSSSTAGRYYTEGDNDGGSKENVVRVAESNRPRYRENPTKTGGYHYTTPRATASNGKGGYVDQNGHNNNNSSNHRSHAYKQDNNRPDEKRMRSHSVTSVGVQNRSSTNGSSTEMNTSVRSRSAENLLDSHYQRSVGSGQGRSRQGKVNRGFSRSVETTIM